MELATEMVSLPDATTNNGPSLDKKKKIKISIRFKLLFITHHIIVKRNGIEIDFSQVSRAKLTM